MNIEYLRGIDELWKMKNDTSNIKWNIIHIH